MVLSTIRSKRRITIGDSFYKLIKYLYWFNQYFINGIDGIFYSFDMHILLFNKAGNSIVKYFNRVKPLTNFFTIIIFLTTIGNFTYSFPDLFQLYHEFLLIGVISLLQAFILYLELN